MSVNYFSYIPEGPEGVNIPLQNFLPSFPKGTFPTWIEKLGISNNLFIDPISANPLLAIELASAGYRILSARSNPIIWLMTEVIASAPTEDDFSTVLNQLLNTRQGKTTLSDHLQSLYETTCENCGNVIQPEGFVWEKGQTIPTSKVYRCVYCADEGERSIDAFDLEKLDHLGNLGIHRSRAFQRVVFGGDYEQKSLNDALDCYLPRALYVCMLLVNRLDQLDLSKHQAKVIRAILLSIFNDAHSLKHWPAKEYRFLQLSVPQKFFEKNLFLCLQEVHLQWRYLEKPVHICYWPQRPDEKGGICFFQRDLAERVKLIPEAEETTVTTVFPRPGQAFWTFSALWAGWLWGKKAVSPMRSALSRRRYDWMWFTKAVHIALKRISPSTNTPLLCLGLFPEYTPNLAFGLFTAMQTVGFQLQGSAYRNTENSLQCQWVRSDAAQNLENNKIKFRDVIQDLINKIGEPVEYHQIIMQIIIENAMQNALCDTLSKVKETDFTNLQNQIKQLFSEVHFLTPFPTELPGGSRWWLVNPKEVQAPISERVESEIRNTLLTKNDVNKSDLDAAICAKFTGLLTPESELVSLVLDSYAESDHEKSGLFRLKPNETTQNREKDLSEAKGQLQNIGRSLDLQTKVDDAIQWIDPKTNKTIYRFFPTISLDISQFVFKQVSDSAIHHVIVFPGSRSELLYYRLQHDPHLLSAVEENWHFLKFRMLRHLAERVGLDLRSWEELLDTDPPLLTPPNQLTIL